MNVENKADNSAEKLGGKVKEGLGKLTGDKHMESEGKTQSAKADIASKIEDVKDGVKGAIDGLTGN